MDKETNELDHYKNMFPSAVPFAHSGETEHPLEDMFRGLYGTMFFFVYEPLNFYYPKNDSSFCLVLMPNATIFEATVYHFFDCAGNLNREKVKAFGRVDCLMKAEDTSAKFSAYKNAVNLAFKDKNPRLEKHNNCEMSISYLYRDKKLIEMPNLFRIDPSTREKILSDGN